MAKTPSPSQQMEPPNTPGGFYLQALALTYAGLATEEHGHPNDGLKMLQLAQVKAWDIPHDQDRRNAVEATALAYSVTALARLTTRQPRLNWPNRELYGIPATLTVTQTGWPHS